MQQHTHGPDGLVIAAEETTPAADTETVEAVADADVRIAEINAGRDVELAKLAVKAEQADTSELDQLRGEVRALREIVERIAPPEPEPDPPAPVVVEAPPVEEPAEPAPPVVENKPQPKPKSGLSWF